ncbi:MAG: hypothetical protein LBT05_11895, partial [Planctomycetaceae bacterium]|nr:hypothetical protein [Planctomycetaceae bacterium]
MKKQLIFVSVLFFCAIVASQQISAQILQPQQFKHYIDAFNADDEENVKQFYPNDKAWDFLSQNMPLFDYPDKEIEKT